MESDLYYVYSDKLDIAWGHKVELAQNIEIDSEMQLRLTPPKDIEPLYSFLLSRPSCRSDIKLIERNYCSVITR